MIKELFFNPPLIQCLFYPFIELHDQIKALKDGKHTAISAVRIFAVIAGIACSIICFLHFKAVHHFFLNITSTLRVPLVFKLPLEMYLCSVCFSGAAGFIAKSSIRIGCKVLFGDPDYFLTNKAEQRLEIAIKEQGYNISKRTIRRITEHCVRNLKSSTNKEVGACQMDWEATLDALLDNADIEVFLEQQQFILSKLRKTQESFKTLTNRHDDFDLEITVERAFHEDDRVLIEEESPTQVAQSSNQPAIIQPTIPLKAPKKGSLAKMSGRIGEMFNQKSKKNLEKQQLQQTPQRNEERVTVVIETNNTDILARERMLAASILTRFIHYKQNQTKAYKELQVGQLIDNCYDILRNKELELIEYVFPEIGAGVFPTSPIASLTPPDSLPTPQSPNITTSSADSSSNSPSYTRSSHYCGAR